MNFKKFENIEKYNLIFNLKKMGKTQKEIATYLNMTQSAISWYMKRKTFLGMEDKEADKGESNIEDEQTNN